MKDTYIYIIEKTWLFGAFFSHRRRHRPSELHKVLWLIRGEPLTRICRGYVLGYELVHQDNITHSAKPTWISQKRYIPPLVYLTVADIDPASSTESSGPDPEHLLYDSACDR